MPDIEARLQALMKKLGAPNPLLVLAATAEHDADLQAAATAQADALLSRIAALTSTLKERGEEWDVLDQATASVLLGDLAILAGWWRGLGDVASTRLESAASDLREAARIAERALKPTLG